MHNQEVAREAHSANRVELELHTLLHFVAQFLAPAPPRPFPYEVRQILRFELDAQHLLVAAELLHAPLGIHRRQRYLVVPLAELLLRPETRRYVELRHDRVGVEFVLLYHVRHFQRVRQDFRALREERRHLVRRLEIFLARVDHALGVAHLRASRERQQHVVRIVVLLVQEMDVVRRDYADAEFLSELERAFEDAHLPVVEVAELLNRTRRQIWAGLRRLVEHDFERIVVAEEVFVPSGDALGLVEAAGGNGGRDLAGDAGRRTMKPLVVFFEEGAVDARAHVEAADVRLGNEAHKVVVARQVLGVEAEMEAPLGLVAALVVAGRGDVRFAAEDRLYGRQVGKLLFLGAAGVVKRLEREKVAVVGDGERAHSGLARPGDERRNLALPVQQRVGRVQVEMDELAHLAAAFRALSSFFLVSLTSADSGTSSRARVTLISAASNLPMRIWIMARLL